MINILLTGAFGNIGESFIKNFIERNNPDLKLRCFDIQNKANLKKSKVYRQKVEVFWGDIRNKDDVLKAVQGQDVIIHIAFILPPVSESNPEFARGVNIGGTENILEAAKLQKNNIRFIFGSSVSVFGPVTPDKKPPFKAGDEVRASDNYTSHKIECERMVVRSGLDWVITRFAVVPGMTFSKELIPIMFEVPLDTRDEFVHTMDVGLALLNAVDCSQCLGKVLLIGGGKRCQMDQRGFLERFLDTYGIGMLPDSAFKTGSYYSDWLDTRESQRLLKYQTRTLNDFIYDIKRKLGPMRHFIRLLRPVIRKYLLAMSPYYEE